MKIRGKSNDRGDEGWNVKSTDDLQDAVEENDEDAVEQKPPWKHRQSETEDTAVEKRGVERIRMPAIGSTNDFRIARG